MIIGKEGWIGSCSLTSHEGVVAREVERQERRKDSISAGEIRDRPTVSHTRESGSLTSHKSVVAGEVILKKRSSESHQLSKLLSYQS